MTLAKQPAAGRVALAYSGGLDSLLCAALLAEYYDASEIIPVYVDVGQGEADLRTARQRLRGLGLDLVVIDARDTYIRDWVSPAIRANGSYCGYPLGTSMSRQLIASKIAELALARSCDAIAEGSTGKGNDQFRFHTVFRILAPGVRVIAPIRDFNLSRPAERKLAREYGLEFYEGISDDKTAWSRSVGSGEVCSLDTQVAATEFIWWQPPEQAPAEPGEHEVEFSAGVPVRADAAAGTAAVIGLLNEAGGRHGVGLIDTIEDGILGLKSRELYEAPAAVILLALHRDLERLCLTKEELVFKQRVDAEWSDLVYHGKAFHPLKLALDDFIARTQEHVSGTVRFALYRGGLRIIARQSPDSLFEGRLRTVEQDSFDQRAMESVVEMYAMSAAHAARRSGRRR